MSKLFIPSGQIFFAGNDEDLLHTISRADGVLQESQNFYCTLSYPDKHQIFHTMRNRLSFVFHCQYAPCKDGFQISYQVLPGAKTILLYIMSILFICGGLATIPNWTNPLLYLGPLFGIAIFLFSLWPRKECITRFHRFFQGKS